MQGFYDNEKKFGKNNLKKEECKNFYKKIIFEENFSYKNEKMLITDTIETTKIEVETHYNTKIFTKVFIYYPTCFEAIREINNISLKEFILFIFLIKF